MIWIPLLVVLTSSVCGMFAAKMTPTSYEAEENDSITVTLDSRIKTNMSFTNLLCFLQSKPLKLLCRMINDVEVPESQHQQFAGRVRCDRDALRDGRIRLTLSRVRTDDSGHYWCDLDNYDNSKKRWVRSTEHFVLKVTSRGENSDVFLTTAEGEKPESPKTENTSYWNKVKTVLGAISVAFLIAAGLIFVALFIYQRLTELLRWINNKHPHPLLPTLSSRHQSCEENNHDREEGSNCITQQQ